MPRCVQFREANTGNLGEWIADDEVGTAEQSGERRAGSEEKVGQLEKRHVTLLELLGEREECIGELTSEVADVREIYKERWNEPMSRLETGGKCKSLAWRSATVPVFEMVFMIYVDAVLVKWVHWAMARHRDGTVHNF